MAGLRQRGVTVNHKRTMVTRIQQERVANPQNVVFGLTVQRHTGAQPGMDEKMSARVNHARTGCDERQIILWDQCCGLRAGKRYILQRRRVHAVVLQGRAPSDQRVQIVQPGPKAGITPIWFADEVQQEAVMVSHQHLPVFAARHTLTQVTHNTRAVWPPVHKVANMNDLCVGAAIGRTVARNQVMRALQQVKLPMNITNSVNLHRLPQRV